MELRRIVIIAGGVHVPVLILISVYKTEKWFPLLILLDGWRNLAVERDRDRPRRLY
jgi:hypothetical protein